MYIFKHNKTLFTNVKTTQLPPPHPMKPGTGDLAPGVSFANPYSLQESACGEGWENSRGINGDVSKKKKTRNCLNVAA